MEDKNWNLIENHLSGSLSPEDKGVLEQKRAEDASFDWEVKVNEQLKELIFRSGIQEELQSVHQQFTSESSALSKPKSRVMGWSLAASVVLLMTWAGIWYSNLSSQGLYEELYTTQGLYTFRDPGSVASDQLKEAFKNQQWEEVVRLRSPLAMQDLEQELLTSIAYLELGQAGKSLQVLTSQPQWGEWQSVVDWYTAMAYLQLGEKAEALVILKKIYSDPNHAFHERISRWELFKLRLI
jgi:hypothetical protein